ncbi:4'-phosphopantetheinyl transferase superfamily protein [Micromonospora sp. NPDC005686]|uniref:4'-phosphopantetheinyl transferase superfamily protein n=1 Tax=unclassified Micromonospora TaxID=2617518 RepID=UPI0033BE68D1
MRAPYDPVEQSAAGRRAASAALAAAGAADAAVPRHADGRPRFPPGFAGSISHTDRLAVAVVLPGSAAVGVDVEEAAISPRVARFVFRESERRALLAPGSELTPQGLFAAKEAAFKAMYGPDTEDLLFWHIRLSRSGDMTIASCRDTTARIWIHSENCLSLAVAVVVGSPTGAT